jgi:Flp pilus assembly protein TadD
MVEAVDHARRAVALEPDNHIHLNDLGWCLVNAESYGEAEEVLKKAVALSPPGYPLARNNLKDLHRRRRRTRRTKER